MPNSYQLHTANGSTTDFSFSQIDGWVSSGFIKVYVDDVLQTTGYTLQNLTAVNPLVRFTTAPVNGKIIKIQRETPATISGFQSNIVNFNNGSVLTEEDLDNLGRGLLHITQEGNDTGSGALGPTTDGLHWNAESKRIQNIGTPTALTDAVTKGYVDGISLYGSAIATPQSWVFSGNGSTTAFTLSPTPATTDAVMFIVEVDGVIQRPTTNYTITAPATLSFVAAPGSGTGNIVVRNFGATRNVAAFADNVSFGGNISVVGNTTLTGSLSVNGGNITTTSNSGNIFNTNVQNLDIGQAATQIIVGPSNSGSTTIRSATTAISNNATVGGTLAVTGNTTLTGDLAVNGADITTTATGTATVFNTNATTLNVGQAATTVSIGAPTGTTTIRNATTAITGAATVGGTLGVTGALTATGGINAVTFNGAPSYNSDPGSANVLARKSYVDSQATYAALNTAISVTTIQVGAYILMAGTLPVGSVINEARIQYRSAQGDYLLVTSGGNVSAGGYRSLGTALGLTLMVRYA